MSFAYDLADTLIFDPVSANRAVTRSALYSVGFRKIDTVATLEALAEALRVRPPDLVVCEAQGVEGPLCDVIQAMRQATNGFNPFIVVMVTAWEKNQSLVRRVVDSGADDLLLRPFSTSVLASRIDAQINRRKGFVITTDYVGPDRRRDSSRPSNAELLTPPNSLRMKAKDRMNQDEATQRLDSELRAARSVLNAEKLRRDAFQVCVLWRLLQERLPGAPRYEADVAKVMALGRDIVRRCHEGEIEATIQPCKVIGSAVDLLEQGADMSQALQMLGQSALGIYQTLNQWRSLGEHLAQVDATVAMIHARNRQQMAS